MLTYEQFKKWEFRERTDGDQKVFEFIVVLDKISYRLAIDVFGEVEREDIEYDIYEKAAVQEYQKWINELSEQRDKLGHARPMARGVPKGNSNLSIFIS